MINPDFDGAFYHATPAENVESILREGLAPGSYLATSDLADYYMETIKDEGRKAVLLKIAAPDIHALDLAPDMPGLEEPICTVLGLKEEDIWECWEQSDKTWIACFSIISSVQTRGRISPEQISIDD
jgi:hypothetical protein